MARLNRFLSALGLISLVVLVGCGSKEVEGDGSIDGISKYRFSVQEGRASLSVVFEKLTIDAGLRIPLARPEGAFVELGPDFESGGALFVISTPLTSLLANNGDLPLVGLPDGRPLPGVREGVLGAIAVNLPVLGITYLYMAEDVFGIFLPVELPNLPVMVTTRIRDEKGNLLGVLVGIPKNSSSQISGALFLFPVEGSVSSRHLEVSL